MLKLGFLFLGGLLCVPSLADEIKIPHLGLVIEDEMLRQNSELASGPLLVAIKKTPKLLVHTIPKKVEGVEDPAVVFFSDDRNRQGYLPNVIDAQFIPPFRSLLGADDTFHERPTPETPIILLRPNYSRESLVHEYVHFLIEAQKKSADHWVKLPSGQTVHQYERDLRAHHLLAEELRKGELPVEEHSKGVLRWLRFEVSIMSQMGLEELGVYRATAENGEHWGVKSDALSAQVECYGKVLSGHVLPRYLSIEKAVKPLRLEKEPTEKEKELIEATAVLKKELLDARNWYLKNRKRP